MIAPRPLLLFHAKVLFLSTHAGRVNLSVPPPFDGMKEEVGGFSLFFYSTPHLTISLPLLHIAGDNPVRSMGADKLRSDGSAQVTGHITDVNP